MTYHKTLRDLKREAMKDPKFKKEYDRLGPEFAIINMIIEKRINEGLTQKELARRVGTKQSAISRFESGTYNPSLSFLYKIADALGVELKITVS